eukprot:CAMPEP_0168524342 /NCGR_PEP_ID=MMETSP0405-20121227/10586_1 /TAXON_ID=498012 /ORGANISM="Trichosphaerium sp, Strain Am-I-7 wt" /LENGTH=175 /DNA_ID=CAMNT_0008546517 /DNA_START=1 /DNA_END=528 /DNA_ORIENTATION=-
MNKLDLCKRETKVLMVGLDGAGKTSILYKLHLGELVSSVPTIGFNIEQVEYKKLTMQIWDVGGQDRIRRLWKHYYNGVNAIIFVVDSADTHRVKEAAMELNGILKDDELRGVPVLVYANKQDIPGAMRLHKVADILDLNVQKGREWHIQASSAARGEGLYEGLEWLNKTVTNSRN